MKGIRILHPGEILLTEFIRPHNLTVRWHFFVVHKLLNAQPVLQFSRGKSSQNRLPWPGSDSTPVLPPNRCITCFTIARPMPVEDESSTCSRLNTPKMRS